MADDEEVPPHYVALAKYFDDALESLESLSEQYLKVSIEWKDGKPVDFDVGSSLASTVRGTRIRFSETLGGIHRGKSVEEMFDEFMELYQDEKTTCATAAEAFAEEEAQMRERMTGRDGFQKQIRLLTDRINLVKNTDSVETLLGDALGLIGKAQRQVEDAAAVQRVRLEPQIINTKNSWIFPFGRRGPIGEWSYTTAVEPWVENMNVLIDRRDLFRRDEFPWVLDISRQKDDVPRTQLLRAISINIISRSVRHLSALRELHRISILRVRFSEGDKDIIKLKRGVKINRILRNMVISLRVLYFGLKEYGKLPRDARKNIRAIMTTIMEVTLTYEYWRQWGKHHPTTDFEEKRLAMLSEISPDVTGREWINWIVEENDWYMRKEFDGPEYKQLRDVTRAVNEEARSTQGREHDSGWAVPLEIIF